MNLLADEPVVLVVGIVLGVPLELCVKVHVEVGQACWLVFILEVCEVHGLASHPVNTLVPIVVKATNEVVSAVLRVDRVEHTLDEVGLLHSQDIGEVGSDLVAGAYYEIKFGRGPGCVGRRLLRDKSGIILMGVDFFYHFIFTCNLPFFIFFSSFFFFEGEFSPYGGG